MSRLAWMGQKQDQLTTEGNIAKDRQDKWKKYSEKASRGWGRKAKELEPECRRAGK